MANATIKITNLPNIGNGLSTTSIFPVVANVNQTDKVTLGNVGNLILNEAGNTLDPAFLSTLAYNVTNAAQPNITSVGTLTSLSVSGNANVGNIGIAGSITVTGNIGIAGSITATGNIRGANLVTPGVLSVTGNSNVGNIGVSGSLTVANVANLRIGGGTDGYVLQTDGAGNLTWTAQTGGGGSGNPGGANTQVQFNDAGSFGGNSGFTFNKTTGLLTAPKFSTANIFNLNGININNSDLSHGQTSGFTIPTNGSTSSPLLAINTYGNIVVTAGADPDNLRSWTFDSTGNLNLPTNTFAVKYANGTSVTIPAAYGNSNVTTLLASFGSNTITTTGNIVAGNLSATGVVTASGNVRGANLNTAGVVSATGNVIGGNLTTAGIVTATGNIQGANLLVGVSTKGLISWDTNSMGVVTDITDDLTGIYLVKNGEAQLYANGNVSVYTRTSSLPRQWTFDTNGNLTLPTNDSSINYANGQPYSGSGNASALVNGDESFALDVDGNVVFDGPGPGGVDRGLVWNYGVGQGGLNSQLRQDSNGITLRAWTENSGGANGFSAPVRIVTNQDGTENRWIFDGQGKLTLPGTLAGNIESNIISPAFNSGITSVVSTGNANVTITLADNVFLDEYSGQVTISNVNAPTQVNGGWWYQATDINEFKLYTDANLSIPVDGSSWPGYAGPGGDAVGASAYSNLSIQGGNVYVRSNDKNWQFDTTGNLTVPSDGSITAINEGGQLGSQLFLNSNLGQTRMSARSTQYTENFDTNSWSNAEYTSTQVNFTDAPNLLNFVANNNTFTYGVDTTFSINGGNTRLPYIGYDGSGSNVIIYTDVTASPDPTTVTSITFYYQIQSYFGVNYDSGRVDVNATGLTIYIENDKTQGPDINLRSGDDIILQGKDKALGTESEGGDINIYGGDGAGDDGTGNFASSGGDIQIVGGQGGFGNSSSGSGGGFARFQGGTGGDAGVASPAGQGGFVQINAGDGGNPLGNSELGASGGYVEIYAGGSTLANSNGAPVSITSGYGGPNAYAGYVEIITPGSDLGSGGVWQFDGKGSIIFPNKTVDLHNGGNQTAQTLQFGNPDYQVVITGPTPVVDQNAQRLIIQGQRGNGTGEGGDVYFWAGDADTNGGDIKIYAGDADVSGYGGYVNIDGGSGIDGGGQLTLTGGYSSGGQGGQVTITPGYSGNANGALLSLNGGQGSGDGGNVNITAGYGGANGGQVTITGGQSALGLPGYGNVYLVSGATTWAFDNTGNMTLPTNSFKVNYANGSPVVLGSAALGNITIDNVTLQGVSGYSGGIQLSASPDDTANLKYLQVRSGDTDSHIHFDTGNNNAYDQYFGDDFKYLKLEAGLAGNVKIGTFQDGGIGQLYWTFDSNGYLTFPRDTNANTDPYLSITGGPNPAISSVDVSLAGPANLSISSDYLNLSGYNGNTVSIYADDGEIIGSNDLMLTSNNSGTVNSWTFGANGNLTLPGNTFAVNYANGTQVSIGGGSYGDSNVVSLLGSFGSNTISTTGNITSSREIVTNGDDATGSTNKTQIQFGYNGTTTYSHWIATRHNNTGANNSILLYTSDGTQNGTFPTNAVLGLTVNNGKVGIGNTPAPGNTLDVGGNVYTTGAITATGKIGYSTGGTATQTGTGQGVTLNQLTGEITLAKSSWTAGDIEVFILQTNKVSTGDYIMAQTINSVYATSFNVNAWVYPLLANSVQIYVKALESVTSTPVVKFLIMKAATA